MQQVICFERDPQTLPGAALVRNLFLHHPRQRLKLPVAVVNVQNVAALLAPTLRYHQLHPLAGNPRYGPLALGERRVLPGVVRRLEGVPALAELQRAAVVLFRRLLPPDPLVHGEGRTVVDYKWKKN